MTQIRWYASPYCLAHFTTALEDWTASPFPDLSSHDPMQNVGGIQFDMLRPWQQHVANWFSKPAGIFDRQIHWIWDAEGNTVWQERCSSLPCLAPQRHPCVCDA